MADSHNRRLSALAPLLAAGAILAIPLGAYVAGYFWLGERRERSGMHDEILDDGHRAWVHEPPTMVRIYPHTWQAMIFPPAAAVETWVRGMEVEVESAD